MTLPVKEYYHNHTTGQVTIEYSDDSTKSFNMDDIVTSQIDPVNGGGGITKIAKLTQAQYDALSTPDPDTLYVIVVG